MCVCVSVSKITLSGPYVCDHSLSSCLDKIIKKGWTETAVEEHNHKKAKELFIQGPKKDRTTRVEK